MAEQTDLPWEVADGIVVCQGGSATDLSPGCGTIIQAIKAHNGNVSALPPAQCNTAAD